VGSPNARATYRNSALAAAITIVSLGIEVNEEI
jgi:hypothetical protein